MALPSRISFNYQHSSFRVRKTGQVKNWLVTVVHEFGFHIDSLGFVFCDDEFLLKLNIEHLDHDTYTDVISFNYSTGKQISGEIYISCDRIKANSKSYKVKLPDELHRVMIHGVLHIIGYQDYTAIQKTEMAAKENYCLSLRSF